jgi:hypothetical protein
MVRNKLIIDVAPITGNKPAIIPIVIDKASLSADRPASGIKRKGIRIFFVKVSTIL